MHIIEILLLTTIIGMIIGLVTLKPFIFHGPNAKKFCKKIYKSNRSNNCYIFKIIPLSCL